MREVKEFLEKALKEVGMNDAEVFHESGGELFTEHFYVTKQIGDEQLSYKISVPSEEMMDDPNRIKKDLAMNIDEVKESFDEYMVTGFEWDKRHVKVSPYNGGWAECQHCGNHVDAPETEYLVDWGDELSDPFPVSRDMSYEVGNMSDFQKNMFKLYLIGRLRETCESQCPNSKYTERFK